MSKPPQLFSQSFLTHLIGQIPPSILYLFIGCAVAYLLYRFVFRVFGQMAMFGSILLLGTAAFGIWKLHNAVASWQTGVLHPAKAVAPAPKVSSNTIINPLTSGANQNGPFTNLDAMSPLAHENAWIIAVIVAVVVIWGILYLVYRGMSPTTRAALMNRMRATPATKRGKIDDSAEFPITGVEVGVQKDNGKPIVIGGKDRFINTLVEGSIGTGKTSRVLKKAVYQDLRSIADGIPMDVIVLDPDGDFSQSVVEMGKKLGVKADVINLTKKKLKSTMSFNPFVGGDLADIIDNVRAALQEKMGKQDGFFQNAQDDLVRTVIQVQVPLWPNTDFAQFADLVTDPLHFRAVCNMVNEHALKRSTAGSSSKKKKKEDTDEATGIWEHERSNVEARYDAMSPTNQSMVLTAARSFLMDTRSEQKMEKLETVTKGLKIVVNELATNPRLHEVFRTDVLPTFDFNSFLSTGKEKKGRLLVVVTGNRPAGKLFGKLFLVTLKMYSLDRDGTEDTRRPVYLYVDEFAVYGTESFTEMFSQARKYRVGMMLAIQARAQLLDVSKKFQDVVEGSCRNKIYFPAPSPEDAKFLEHSLGSVKNVKETHTENKLNWFWFDDRNIDRRISTTESVDPRFRQEDVAYGLKKDEAIFVMTADNQAMAPCVGITSFAEVWTQQKRGFYNVNGMKPTMKAKLKWSLFRERWTSAISISKKAIGIKGQETNLDSEVAANELRLSEDGRETKTTPTAQMVLGSINNMVAPVQKQPLDPVKTGRTDIPANHKVYVKPDADPNKVIPISSFLNKQQLPTKEKPIEEQPVIAQVTVTNEKETKEQLGQKDQHVSETQIPVQSDMVVPQVKRIDLRKRTTVATSQESNDGTKQGKICPSCRTGSLILTADGRKWQCPACGFERKKR